MRRSAVVPLAAVPVLVAAAVGTLTAQAGPAHAGTTATSLTFTATPDGVGSEVDVAPPGPSAGDQHLETGVLTLGNRHAGSYTLVGELVALRGQSAEEQLSVTVHLAGGDVVALAGIPATDNYTLPVVGGTGTYTDSGGTLRVRPAGDRFAFTLRVVR